MVPLPVNLSYDKHSKALEALVEVQLGKKAYLLLVWVFLRPGM